MIGLKEIGLKSTARASALVLLLAAGHPAAALAQEPASAESTAASQQLAAIIADYETFARGVDPITAASEGDRAAIDRLPSFARADELTRRSTLEAFRGRLAAIDASGLGEEDALNHALLTWSVALSLERIGYDEGRVTFTSEGGTGGYLAWVAGSTRIVTRADAEAYLTRLGGMATLYDEALTNSRRGVETGLVQPRITVERALTLIEAEARLTPDADPLLAPFAQRPAAIPEADWNALRARAETIVADEVMPARQRFATFIRTDYLAAAPEALGLGQRPGGREYYAFLARAFTTTEMTPDEIHALGLSEVARIRAEMEQEMAAAGWTGSFAAFLAFLRSDPQFYATSREDLLMHASEIAKRADDQLPRLFGTLPRLPYGVRPVPADIEANYTTGRYNPGSYANGIAGGYMVNTSALDQRPLYELPSLTLHEAVPGHHLQIALQQELGDLPWFRRNADATAFVEGWGLYSEYLGYEMGIYRTPYERFGRLSYEMWRACRLVADTGIHWLGWDIEQARACFRDNSALSELNIQTELERYISWPGQALAYKVGEQTILRVRRRAEQQLGERFDVRRFHDAVLLGGPVPMDVLEARIDAWIAAEQARGA